MTSPSVQLIAAALAISVLGQSLPAVAEPNIEVGTLVCKGGDGVGLLLGSKKSYACTFNPASGAEGEFYQATVSKIGLDIGFTTDSTMIWTVLSANQTYTPRSLSGSYTGASADASVGVGVGAKVLVGGSDSSLALQPVSVQGQTGLNLAVGIAALTLR